MISDSKISKIKLLRNKGLSHRAIAEQVNVGLGIAFKYSQEIKLTKAQRNKLKLQTAIGAPRVMKKNWGVRGGKMTKFRIKYSKKVLITMIRDYYAREGRIPTKREFNTHWQSIRREFGSWNKAIEVAGYEYNKEKFTKKYKANDGHICDSLSEKIIDDWLYARSLEHKVLSK